MEKFEALGVAPEILRAIQELGFDTPTPVQEKVIPQLLEAPRDFVVLSQTGTGKTASFGIPLLQYMDVSSKNTQALILCPTRELCLQVASDLSIYSKYMDAMNIVAVYGGASIENQIRDLKKGAQVIVATPGRLVDLLKRKVAKLNHIQTVVLDEADEMLNMGFSDSLNFILSEIPEERNILLFSATMPQEISHIAKKYMDKPIEVTIGKKNSGSDTIKHICYTVHARDKYLALKRIADYNPNIYGIVFCRTRKETQEIADKLIKDGYNADSLHGDLSQVQRDYVMQKFRLKNVQLLVATDVAARGLDVDELTHVIHFSLPDDIEVYTHRSGRTGRAGRSGISVAIIHTREKQSLRQIEKIIQKEFQHLKVPTGREICEKQLFHLVDKMEKVEVAQEEIDDYLPAIFKKLEWLDKEELIRKFVSLEFNILLEYYRTANDLETPSERDFSGGRERDRDGRKSSRKADNGYTRIFINAGKIDGMNPGGLIELINQNTRGKQIPIGKIDLMQNFSFFEVDSAVTDTVLASLNDVKYNKRTIRVELAGENNGGGKSSRGGDSGGGYNGGGYKASKFSKFKGGGGYRTSKPKSY